MKTKKAPRRFTVDINEGAFFYEPWLNDLVSNKCYRYDKIPRNIMRDFAKELRAVGKITPDEIQVVLDYVID